VRGDGPNLASIHDLLTQFSPRAWGWSGDSLKVCLRHPVLPTCVGMVRNPSRSSVVAKCSPHVRGDGPVPRLIGWRGCEFSPRAWGWSVTHLALIGLLAVLPTCVGMVRSWCRSSCRSSRSPHVRGDGPAGIYHAGHLGEFSPRAWGWSDDTATMALPPQVLPTCVGMVRGLSLQDRLVRRSPHVRGDGPSVSSSIHRC